MFQRSTISMLLLGLLLAVSAPVNAAEDRRERVLKDKPEVDAIGHWIYNDLPQALTEAARTRKPMLVVFRCIP